MSRVSVDTLIERSLDNMGDVHSAVKDKTLYIIYAAYEEGINVQISSGLRTFEEQARLFAKGRTAPGNIVTNAEPGESVHNYGLAIDYFLTTWDGSTAVWTVNDDWRRVAEIGKSLGFEWGGDWSSFVDYPHLQLTGSLGWRDLKAGSWPSGELLNEGVMREGHSGWSVFLLQKKLVEVGYNIDTDGLFGPGTDEALRNFQEDNGLVVDGFYGPITQETLESVLKNVTSASNEGDEEMTDTNQPSDWAKDDWEEATLNGYFDGTRPKDDISREETAIVVNRIRHNFLKLIESNRKEINVLKEEVRNLKENC